MAIIEAVPGIVVTVEVDGQPLKEWQDTVEAEVENEVVRYVEAASGKEFIVKVSVTDEFVFEYNSITLRLLIDGNRVKTYTLWATGNHVFDTMRIGSSLHKYCFSKLEIAADDDDLESEAPVAQSLGEIQVKMYHTEKINESRQTTPASQGRKGRKNRHSRQIPVHHGAISEKAVKGRSISHSVSFGPGRSLPPSRIKREDDHIRPWHVRYPDKEAATYAFRYRSLDALRSMLIVPRTPSPQLVERDEDVKYELDYDGNVWRHLASHPVQRAVEVIELD